MEQLNIQDNDEIEVDVSEIVHVLLNKNMGNYIGRVLLWDS